MFRCTDGHPSFLVTSCGMKKGLLWVFNLRLPKNYIELSCFFAEKKKSLFLSRERESVTHGACLEGRGHPVGVSSLYHAGLGGKRK